MCWVESAPRIAAWEIPGGGLRPGCTAIIGDQSVEFTRISRNVFWLCPMCGRKVHHLYVVDGLKCRRCAGLRYAIKHGPVRWLPGVARVRRLRRKLGARLKRTVAQPGPERDVDLAPFTTIRRPPRVGRRISALIREVYAEEMALLDELRTANDRLERNLRKQSAARVRPAAKKA